MEQRIAIRIIDSIVNRNSIVYLSKGENLLEAIIRAKLSISTECGGIGTCGKCKIRVIEGALDISSQDRELLSETELMEGYRLACLAYPEMDCTIMLCSEINDNYRVVTESPSYKATSESSREAILDSDTSLQVNKTYAFAIDLGTTTLAFALISLPEGNIIDKYTSSNPQRIYGADVVSRIKASNEGKLKALSYLIREELSCGLLTLVERQHINMPSIDKLVISGNTTMIHMLMEYPCDGLGAYPFTPVNIGLINAFTDDLLGIEDRIPIIILPSISVFVGGDITAGLLACGFYKKEKPCLFIDLGTNGEIALGDKERILVTSTAAGPAFEGGNISCGMGSIPGAICNVSISNGILAYETINDSPPVGICGTGVIELVAALLKEGLIDISGILVDTYFDNGYPVAGMKLTQHDIRELQLAKSAIRAGVDILLKSLSLSFEQLDEVYIAGGFGYHLNIEKAVLIGLLPEVVIGKVKAVGNTSLSGAIYSIMDSEARSKMKHIISSAEEINLSRVEEFNDLFINNLSF